MNIDSETKPLKISVLTDYQVIGLAPLDSAVPTDHYYQGYYNKEIYIPNRRSASVAVELTSEGMDNCKLVRDKLLKHPNVIQIAFRGNSDYLCRGVSNRTGDILKHFFGKTGGSFFTGYSLNIIGSPIQIFQSTTVNIFYGPELKKLPNFLLYTDFGLGTSKLKEKVMLINYTF